MEYRIRELETKLERAIRERDNALETLYWTQQELKMCQARLSEFERQRARAYDAYVTNPREEAPDHD